MIPSGAAEITVVVEALVEMIMEIVVTLLVEVGAPVVVVKVISKGEGEVVDQVDKNKTLCLLDILNYWL